MKKTRKIPITTRWTSWQPRNTQKCQKNTQNRISFGKKKLPCDFGFFDFGVNRVLLLPSFLRLRRFLRKCERVKDFKWKCERLRVIFQGFSVIFKWEWFRDAWEVFRFWEKTRKKGEESLLCEGYFGYWEKNWHPFVVLNYVSFIWLFNILYSII